MDNPPLANEQYNFSPLQFNDSTNTSFHIVKRWLHLQKILKEEITLQDISKASLNNLSIVLKQQCTYKAELLAQYQKYFNSKLITRKTIENVIEGSLQAKPFELNTEEEKTLGNAIDPIQNLFLLMRGNFNYIIKTISIIDEIGVDAIPTINTLIELFAHQFFDNLVIPEEDEDELLMLCYLLLQKEVNQMNSASVSSFLDDKNTFVGRLIKSYTKKHDLSNYLSMTLGSMILSIENLNDYCFDFNPKEIRRYLTQNNFKQHLSLNNDTEKGSKSTSFISNVSNEGFPSPSKEKNSVTVTQDYTIIQYLDNNDKHDSPQAKQEHMPFEINTPIKKPLNDNSRYFQELTHSKLIDLIEEEKDPYLKAFYTKQNELICQDPDIFTNKKILQSINEFADKKKEVLSKYRHNFIRIKEYIDTIIQSLIDKIKTLPYTLRCICKAIYFLIDTKFPNISEVEKKAFIGEFIFGKCILPTLVNCDINAVITSTILSFNTKKCLRTIAKVLTKINRGLFFESNIDTDYTIFNYYIAEVTPLINQFYLTLIDVELPKALQERIEKQKELNKTSELSFGDIKARRDKKKKRNSTVDVFDIYDNSKKDLRGLIDIHCCICYSIEDIILLLQIIKPKIKLYASIDIGGFLEKTIEKIAFHEAELKELMYKSHKRNFFLLFRDPKGKEISQVHGKEKKTYSFIANEGDSRLIPERVKFCIKKVLTGLNLINNKDYSYLDSARSNEEFLNAMSETLQELEELNEKTYSHSIPLKWYSGYIKNNIDLLDSEYKENDYDKLFSELLEEEREALMSLQETSSKLMMSDGLNIRFAEKIIEKAAKSETIMKQIERMIKIDQFITKTELGVCIVNQRDEVIDKINLGLLPKNSNQIEEKNQSRNTKIIVMPIDKCLHKNSSPLQKASKESMGDLIKAHVLSIKDFINKFGQFKEITEDIVRENPQNKIYETLESYLKLVRIKLKDDLMFKSEEHKLILEKISNYIMKSIYNDVFPKNPIDLDKEFFQKTDQLKRVITPAHLEIKALYVNELKDATECIRKIDDGHSAYEKLTWISKAYCSVISLIKFSSGKYDDVGADELSPIFQYIIIQARPRRFYSNIQYLKTFLPPVELDGQYGYLLALIEASAEFIRHLTIEELDRIKEKFLKRCNS